MKAYWVEDLVEQKESRNLIVQIASSLLSVTGPRTPETISKALDLAVDALTEINENLRVKTEDYRRFEANQTGKLSTRTA